MARLQRHRRSTIGSVAGSNYDRLAHAAQLRSAVLRPPAPCERASASSRRSRGRRILTSVSSSQRHISLSGRAPASTIPVFHPTRGTKVFARRPNVAKSALRPGPPTECTQPSLPSVDTSPTTCLGDDHACFPLFDLCLCICGRSERVRQRAELPIWLSEKQEGGLRK